MDNFESIKVIFRSFPSGLKALGGPNRLFVCDFRLNKGKSGVFVGNKKVSLRSRRNPALFP